MLDNKSYITAHKFISCLLVLCFFLGMFTAKGQLNNDIKIPELVDEGMTIDPELTLNKDGDIITFTRNEKTQEVQLQIIQHLTKKETTVWVSYSPPSCGRNDAHWEREGISWDDLTIHAEFRYSDGLDYCAACSCPNGSYHYLKIDKKDEGLFYLLINSFSPKEIQKD